MDGTGDLHHETTHADHASVDINAVDIGELFSKCFQRIWAFTEAALSRNIGLPCLMVAFNVNAS
jgi:hypothetical protein